MVALQSLVLLAALSAPADTILLEFSSQYCGPCKTMAPVVRRLTNDGYPVRVVDVDQDRDLAAQFRVSGVPCFVMIVGGREVDRVTGATSYDRLTQMFQAAGRAAPAKEQPQVRGQSPDAPLSAAPRALAARSGEPDLLQRMAAREFTQSELRVAEERGDKSPAADDYDQRGTPQERAMWATVRLKIDEGQANSYGTGTIIDVHGDEALILTCGHIFRESQGKGAILVEFCGAQAQAVPGHLLAYDLKRDVALVSIRPNFQVTAMQVAPPSFQTQRGARVFSVGCDHGREARLAASRLAAIDRYVGPPNFEVTGAPAEGRSGGGLFSEDGYLIGVCNASDLADNEGIYAALPSVHWQLAQIGQKAVFERAEMAAIRARAAQPTQSDVAMRSDAAPPPRMADNMPAAGERAAPPAESIGGRDQGHDDSEVVVTVRSRSNPQARSETFVLERPSPDFLNRLNQEYQNGIIGAGRSMAETATRPPAPRSSVRAQSADR